MPHGLSKSAVSDVIDSTERSRHGVSGYKPWTKRLKAKMLKVCMETESKDGFHDAIKALAIDANRWGAARYGRA